MTRELALFVAGFEDPPGGPALTPYLCPAGVWTYGSGATRDLSGNPVTASTPRLSLEQARTLLMRDLEGAANDVRRLVVVPLNRGQFNALVSFTYNLGGTNLKASALLRKLNAGDLSGAAAEFPNWNRGGGRVLAGLVRRRADERAVFTGEKAL